MPIEFHCSTCQSLLRIPDNASGRWISCPNCGSTNPHPNTVPASQPDFSAPPVDQYPPKQSSNPYGAPSTVSYVSTPHTPRQVVVARTLPAAIVWLVLSILNLMITLMIFFQEMANLVENRMTEDDWVTMSFSGVLSLFAMTGILGAICMLKMRFHTFCIIASVSTIISSVCCCFIPAGAGIWAIVTLLLPDTRHHFLARSSTY